MADVSLKSRVALTSSRNSMACSSCSSLALALLDAIWTIVSIFTFFIALISLPSSWTAAFTGEGITLFVVRGTGTIFGTV